jgi:hypothetical protein
VVDAFLAASRDGDFERLLAVLSPQVILRADDLAVRIAATRQAHGAPGAVWTMGGQVRAIFVFTTMRGVIAAIDLVMDPQRLRKFEVQTL